MRRSFILILFLGFSVYLFAKDMPVLSSPYSEKTENAAAAPAHIKKELKGKKYLFTKDIGPLIYKNCTSCHRRGQVAPFPLMSYEDVIKHSKEIVIMTSTRQMPPWKAKHGYGSFAGERRLTDEQIKMIGQWVKSGMQMGEEKDMPPPPEYADAWPLGKPDLVIYMPQSMTIPSDGADFFMSFVIPLDLPEDKYVKAIDILPTNRRVVHHTTISMDPTGTVSHMEQEYMKGNMKGNFDFGTTIGAWASGWRVSPYPDGYARVLPKKADLLLETHFHPTGKVEVEKTAIGFYLVDKKQPKEPMDVLLYTTNIDLLPNKVTHIIIDTITQMDLNIFSLSAHAHYICKEIKVRAILPDRSEVPMLWIPDWDFNWQELYRYEALVSLPKGTRIIADFTFDNTSENSRNPSSPPVRVKFGLESMKEMATITMSTLPK